MSPPITKVCVIGAGPSGMSALYHFGQMQSGDVPHVVCYEKQSTWGGLWNLTWRTGTDKFGEKCHASMYKHLWSNGPKECIEFPDYTFEEHFGKAIPSFPPREVLRDYLEGRWTKKSKTDLRSFIKFNSVVRFVRYNKLSDDFTVTVHDLTTDVTQDETFSHVIVAVGIFNVPTSPDIRGIDNFQGRAIHSHDFRNAGEFKGQRLLVVGASYSAEDIALQCLKYGAKHIVCTWRTNPMGFKWPKGIEERPLVQKMDGNTAHFKDGSTAEIDAIILCTGYQYQFPFMEESLRLKSKLSYYPDNLYKGTVWMKGGNNKLFYLGVQDQFYTFTLFEAQAMWACKGLHHGLCIVSGVISLKSVEHWQKNNKRGSSINGVSTIKCAATLQFYRYVLGKLPHEPKPVADMAADVTKWLNRNASLKGCSQQIDFQTDFLEDLATGAGYSEDAMKAGALLHIWKEHKAENIATYRDQSFSSIYTGTVSPKSVTWMEAFDDSIEAFVK